MVSSTDSAVNPWGESIEEALDERLLILDSGRYRKENERVLTAFASWLAEERGVTEMEDLTMMDMQAYSQHLRRRYNQGDGIESSRTAKVYFDYVHAWFEWCVKNRKMDNNPAKPDAASDDLPKGDPKEEEQFWTKRERDAICATADRRVDESLDDDGMDTARAYRDRALVYTLAYSGCRGAELVRVKDDRHRDGITWGDVDLERGILTVLGKARDRDDPLEPAPMFSEGVSALSRWKQYRNPANDEVVFPRLDRAADDEKPDAITTQTIRDVLANLCEWSQYDFDEHLLPHGARRALGDELYAEKAEWAQDLLRHKNIETTHDSYKKERQATVRDEAEKALFGDDDE